jgi:hypothetical protein
LDIHQLRKAEMRRSAADGRVQVHEGDRVAKTQPQRLDIHQLPPTSNEQLNSGWAYREPQLTLIAQPRNDRSSGLVPNGTKADVYMCMLIEPVSYRYSRCDARRLRIHC